MPQEQQTNKTDNQTPAAPAKADEKVLGTGVKTTTEEKPGKSTADVLFGEDDAGKKEGKEKPGEKDKTPATDKKRKSLTDDAEEEAEEEDPSADDADTEEEAEEEDAESEEAEDDEEEGEGDEKKKPPTSYKLKLPEKSLLSKDHVKDVAEYAKKNKLTQEQAQAVLDRESKIVGSFMDRKTAELQEMSVKWIDDVMADEEIGGDNADQSVLDSNRALNKFGTPAFKEILKQTGYGNHPELIRIFARIGRAMGEDRFVDQKKPKGAQKSRADILFGDSDDGDDE